MGEDGWEWRRWWRWADVVLAVVVAGLAAGDVIGGLARWPAFLAQWSDSRAADSWHSWSIILVAYLLIRFSYGKSRRRDPAATESAGQPRHDDPDGDRP
jgi:hypothetical protein